MKDYIRRMEHELVEIPEATWACYSLEMNMMKDRTAEVWKTFMPLFAQIPGKVNLQKISIQNYGGAFDIHSFTPETLFMRGAAVEISGEQELPTPLETLKFRGGLYLKTRYKGLPQNAVTFFQKLYLEVLPQMKLQPDNRIQFELLLPNYSPENPDSEEDVFIPVRPML